MAWWVLKNTKTGVYYSRRWDFDRHDYAWTSDIKEAQRFWSLNPHKSHDHIMFAPAEPEEGRT